VYIVGVDFKISSRYHLAVAVAVVLWLSRVTLILVILHSKILTTVKYSSNSSAISLLVNSLLPRSALLGRRMVLYGEHMYQR